MTNKVLRKSIWNKKPTRCHLVYFIYTYQLLNMFGATMCPSPGADNLVVFSLPCGVVPWLCRQLDPVSCTCVCWKVRSTPDTRTANRI